MLFRSNNPNEATVVLRCSAGSSVQDYRAISIRSSPRGNSQPATEEIIRQVLEALVKAFSANEAKGLESGVVDLAGRKSGVVLLEMKVGGVSRTSVIAFILAGDRLYEVNPECASANFDRYADTFARILTSVKFKEST